MRSRVPTRVVDIGPVGVEHTSAGSRVTAMVDGTPVWFESPDVELSPSAEAFGCAFLIPALHSGARLRLASAVDPAWSANIRRLRPVLYEWWRYPMWPIEAAVRAGDESVTGASPAGASPGASALFFSAGVDSFHRLLRGGIPIDWIVTLLGFDFPPDDRVRAEAVEASTRHVAAVTGTRAVLVRTNARAHPLVAAASWLRVYGGIMAGVGHLLAPGVASVQISTSLPGDVDLPTGSHVRIDRMWSSSRLSVVHVGHGSRRIDKLRSMAAEPLVREHLRVCWRNYTPAGNCSRCGKCLMAMLILEECGELENSRVFEGRHELARRLDALSHTPDRAHSFAEVARSARLDPAVATAALGVVRRSPNLMRWDARMRRALLASLRLRRRLGARFFRGDA